MKSLFGRVDTISIRMLLSYLSILLIPLCAIVVIYSTAMDAILASRQETALSALEETSRIAAARLEEVHNISAYIHADSSVNAIINRSYSEKKPRDIYAIFQAIDSIPSYKLTNQMIEDVFIFFNKAEYIIKPPNAFASTPYSYATHVSFHGVSYDEILALSRQRHFGQLMVRADAGGRDVLLLRSIPSALTTPEGLIAIRLNTATLDAMIGAAETGPGGGAYILTSGGQILSDVGDAPFTEAQLGLLLATDSPSCREIEHENAHYLLCQVQAGSLTYLSLTRKDHLLGSIAPIRLVILVMGSAAVLMGGLICVALWRRRRRVVKNIATTAREAGVAFAPARSEASFLEHTVSSLASAVDTLRETMDRQREALGQTVIQGCLTGAFPSQADMRREVSALGLKLFAPRYHVVRVSLLDPWEIWTENAQILPYRIFLKQFFTERLSIPHVTSDIDSTSFVLLLMDSEPRGCGELAPLFRALSEEVAREDFVVPSFAISDPCADLWDVHGRFEQTEKILQYMALLEQKGVFAADSLPRSTEPLYFPMDMEIRLIQAMKGGTAQELETAFDQVMEENLSRRTLGVAMLAELREALRRGILRGIQEAGRPMDTVAIASLSTAKSLADLRRCALRAREQLSRMPADAQGRGEDEGRRTKETLLRLIEENLSNPAFSLHMLSEMAGASESALYRSFKDYFGVSFSAHLEQRRISKAFELLKNQVLIKDVAEQVGYISDHTFRRAFKRVMKVSPSQFAKLTYTE